MVLLLLVNDDDLTEMDNLFIYGRDQRYGTPRYDIGNDIILGRSI